jgi:hypothetical protein
MDAFSPILPNIVDAIQLSRANILSPSQMGKTISFYKKVKSPNEI